MKLRNYLYIINLVIAINFFVSPDIVQACPASKTAVAIKHAETARQQAAAVGSEWINTEAMIQAAKDAAKRGEFDAALQLATEAEKQGKLGYNQAMQQQNIDFPGYLQ